MTALVPPAGAEGPVPPSERLLAADLARGLMLALIAIANSAIYLFGREYGFRQHIVEHDVLDRLAGLLVVTLVDQRAYPLFAALFGYGMVQLARRRRAAGDTDAGVVRLLRRRNWLLILAGALHAVLLFSGDVLGLYGLVGLLLAGVVLRASDRSLLVGAAGWLVAVAVGHGLVFGTAGGSAGRSYFWSFELADPLAAMALRPVEWVMSPIGMLGVVSAVLVGIWAARRRILEEPEQHRRLTGWVAVVGIGSGVLGGLPSGLIVGGFWEPPTGGVAVALTAVHAVTGVFAGLGYAALVGLCVARFVRGRPGRITVALAAAGQRSLSCYLAQSVGFVALLAPYAGGLGGRLGSAATVGVATGVWAVTVIAADACRRFGVRGPAEAVLRWMVYRGRRAAKLAR